MGLLQWISTLSLISLGVWFFLYYKPSISTGEKTNTINKRKAKKKSKKKKATETSISQDGEKTEESKEEESNTDERNETTSPTIQDYFNESDSDDEDGRSAAQILSQKHFGTAVLGGSRKLKPTAPTIQLQEGQRIVARYKKQEEWYPGTVMKIQRGNLYIIQYDDGEIESKVPIQCIRVTNDGETKQDDDTGSSPLDSESEEEEFATEDDEWEVVSSKVYQKKTSATENNVTHSSGLTKKQRENKRRKEKLKEQKELIRSQAQESGLHARWGGTKNTWRPST